MSYCASDRDGSNSTLSCGATQNIVESDLDFCTLKNEFQSSRNKADPLQDFPAWGNTSPSHTHSLVSRVVTARVPDGLRRAEGAEERCHNGPQ
jgi:hypothetical protein